MEWDYDMAAMQEPSPGRLVATARSMWGQTQQELADLLTQITGEEWTQPQISAIESGRRALRVSELPAFAEAQRVKTTWYLGHGVADSFAEASGPYVDPDDAATHNVTGGVLQFAAGSHRRASKSVTDARKLFAARRAEVTPDGPDDGTPAVAATAA